MVTNSTYKIGFPYCFQLKLKMKYLVLAVHLLSCLVVSPIAIASDQSAQLQNQITFEDDQQQLTLNLTGHAIRKKFFFSIYHLVHYSDYVHAPLSVSDDDAATIYFDILAPKNTKQISMVFLRDLKAEQIQKTLTEGVENNSNSTEFEQIQVDLKDFSDSINQDVKRHDRFVLRWLSDGRLISIYNDKTISVINNPTLARLLWSIWFSENSVVNRSKLIQNLLKND
jgi:hypothetical protein